MYHNVCDVLKISLNHFIIFTDFLQKIQMYFVLCCRFICFTLERAVLFHSFIQNWRPYCLSIDNKSQNLPSLPEFNDVWKIQYQFLFQNHLCTCKNIHKFQDWVRVLHRKKFGYLWYLQKTLLLRTVLCSEQEMIKINYKHDWRDVENSMEMRKPGSTEHSRCIFKLQSLYVKSQKLQGRSIKFDLKWIKKKKNM